jgi:hypothetical protein
VVDRIPSCAVSASVVGTIIRANNCVPGCPGPCHTVSWPRPDTPFDQGKKDDTGLHRTGRDSPGLSDNAEVGSSILPSPTKKDLVRVVVDQGTSDTSRVWVSRVPGAAHVAEKLVAAFADRCLPPTTSGAGSATIPHVRATPSS